jgi:hypothetical protein
VLCVCECPRYFASILVPVGVFALENLDEFRGGGGGNSKKSFATRGSWLDVTVVPMKDSESTCAVITM